MAVAGAGDIENYIAAEDDAVIQKKVICVENGWREKLPPTALIWYEVTLRNKIINQIKLYVDSISSTHSPKSMSLHSLRMAPILQMTEIPPAINARIKIS